MNKTTKKHFALWGLAALMAAGPALFPLGAEEAERSGGEAPAREAAGTETGGGVKEPNVQGRFGKAIGYYFLDSAGSTRHLEPYRMTTISGFLVFSGIGFGAANDFLIGPADILGKGDTGFKKDGYLKINLNDIAHDRVVEKNGLNFHLGFNLGGRQSLLFGIDRFHKTGNDTGNEAGSKYSGWGFSLLKSIDARFDFNFSKEFLQLLAGGLQNDEKDLSFKVSGSVFAEMFNLRLYKQWDEGTSAFSGILSRLSVSVAPSWYIPVIYLPSSNISVRVVNTDNRTNASLQGNLLVYSAADFGAISGGDFSGFDLRGGFDITCNAEYRIFTVLDAGVTATNIPVLPAHLTNGMQWTLRGTIYDGDGLIDALGDGEINFPAPGSPEYIKVGNKRVVRPMRWDFYMNFRPFRSDALVIKPHTGLSVLYPAEAAREDRQQVFNLGVEAAINAGRWLTLSFYTGEYDGLAHNKAGLDFHWKRFGTFINMEMISQDYIRSWSLRGIKLNTGCEFGW